MIRITNIQSRKNWIDVIESNGLTYHQDYYQEGVAYEFNSQEIDRLELATQQIFELCCMAMERVLNDEDTFRRFKSKYTANVDNFENKVKPHLTMASANLDYNAEEGDRIIEKLRQQRLSI